MNEANFSLPKAVIAGAAVFGVALIATGFLVSQTDIYVRSLGGGELSEGKVANTISVNGQGKVFAKPDMVTFSITVSERRDTTSDALDAANEKISKVQDALKSEGVDEKNIQTSNFSIYPEYDWQRDQQTLLGYRASQTLTIEIKDIDEKATKAATVIDKVSEIQQIEISSIAFDIEDKTELFSLAREEAFKKAKQKAEELANLGDVELLKPISITDSNIDYNPPVFSNYAKLAVDQAESSAGSTSISTGQLELNITVEVVFGIE